jgi:HNH endonuclease
MTYDPNVYQHGRKGKRFIVNEETGCWEWQYAPWSGKYGRHQRVWEAYNGPVPEGFELHHTCSNENMCVNPAHLEVIDIEIHRAAHWSAYLEANPTLAKRLGIEVNF